MSFAPVSDSDDNTADESADPADETGEVAETSEGDDREMPLTDASEMHAAMIESTASQDELEDLESDVEAVRDEVNKLRERTAEGLRDTDDLEDIERVLEALRSEVDELRTENQTVRERIDVLEEWKNRADWWFTSISDDICQLITASDLDATGTCPACGDAPLEIKKPFGAPNRVECAGEDCGHVAATLK